MGKMGHEFGPGVKKTMVCVNFVYKLKPNSAKNYVYFKLFTIRSYLLTSSICFQFLFSQLFFSYGMYIVYLENDNVPAVDSLWAAIIFLIVYKFFSKLTN